MTAGYYRFPTLHGDRIIFTSEDDLWESSTSGGLARRLTDGHSISLRAAFSPDGEHLAYSASDEGIQEIYVMPAKGGAARRLTYGASVARVLGFSPDGTRVRFASNLRSAMARLTEAFEVPLDGGDPEPLRVGPVTAFAEDASGRRVLARHQDDLALWKRYRGGRVGAIWVDGEGQGEYQRILQDLGGNLARPMWLGERLAFVSDHEGIAQLYACALDGSGVERLTDHADFFVRHPSSDGERIVYHAGAEVWLWEAGSGARRVEIELASPRMQCARRFVKASSYLESASLHPEGHSVLVTSRGRPYTMGLWEGAVRQPGEAHGVRYRFSSHLPDGERMVTLSDAGGEEALEIHRLDGSEDALRLESLDLGRVVDLKVCPEGARVAVSNMRQEIAVIDLDAGEVTVLERSEHQRIAGFNWSKDGRYLAYAIALEPSTTSISIAEVATSAIHRVTAPEFHDVSPVFDPRGRYLYFLSYRDFDPVYDEQVFDLGFPRAQRLCMVTLRSDLESPFVAKPRPLESKKGKKKDAEGDVGDEKGDSSESRPGIDFEGIAHRVQLFPIKAARLGRIRASDDRVFFSVFPVSGSLSRDWRRATPAADGTLKAYHLENLEETKVMSRISSFDLGLDGKTLVVQSGRKLRVLKASHTEKAGEDKKPGRNSGWLSLSRIAVEVEPHAEWRQMLREAWRLMRDQFWTEDMSRVDWEAVYARYAPLVERVGSRFEMSDLVWEMQGELGTSHAYELGGDYRQPPTYRPGYLGADGAYDAEAGGYRIDRIARGDVWDPKASSPLSAPGVHIGEGDVIVAVNGQAVTAERSVPALLVRQAGRHVELVVAQGDDERRSVTVRTLRSEQALRYREWVANNRAWVREASGGQVGYVHVPNMGPQGFSEFHRAYSVEARRPALVVDVRFNGGGHVSMLLLEKLARHRVGYSVSRWGQPEPYPRDSVLGPIVALTNENAGSDGDIFSHAFKLMGLGTLVGMRTWGGVIGIWPRHRMVDNSLTSQPEFSYWFEDVEWQVENWGTEPDVVVDIAPHEHAAERDPQLERALAIVLEQLEAADPSLPEFGNRPDLSLPWKALE